MTKLLFASTVPATLEAFLLPLADACRENGWLVEAVASGASVRKRLVGRFHRLHDVSWHRRPLDLANLLAIRECADLLRGEKYELVHVHTPVASFVTRMAARLAGYQGQIVYTAHGFHFVETGHPITNALYLALEKLAGRRTDRLVVINREDRNAALKHRLVSPERLVLINGVGVDVLQFSQARISFSDRKATRIELGLGDRRVITMIAEFNPGKRHVDLIEAIPEILATTPEAFFVFAGTGPMLETIKTRARELGVEKHTRFLGFCRDIPGLLSVTDVVVLPSLREGLPVSLMEAMSMEVPFVGTDIRGIRELAEGRCGLLVPARARGELAKAIATLLANPEVAAEAGRNGRTRVMERYELGLIVRQHMQLYKNLLGLTNE